MKVPLIIIPQSRLFLRFCVRMVCFQVFLVSFFISSQTLFSGSDSIIYISEEASFYKDSQTVVSVAAPVDIESSDSRPPVYHKSKRLKSSLKAASATACAAGKREDPFRFAFPLGNQQIGSTGSLSSQAVTGDYFSRKLFRQMMSPAFPQPYGIISVKKKPFGLAFYPIRVIKISLQQYSRPPPLI